MSKQMQEKIAVQAAGFIAQQGLEPKLGNVFRSPFMHDSQATRRVVLSFARNAPAERTCSLARATELRDIFETVSAEHDAVDRETGELWSHLVGAAYLRGRALSKQEIIRLANAKRGVPDLWVEVATHAEFIDIEAWKEFLARTPASLQTETYAALVGRTLENPDRFSSIALPVELIRESALSGYHRSTNRLAGYLVSECSTMVTDKELFTGLVDALRKDSPPVNWVKYLFAERPDTLNRVITEWSERITLSNPSVDYGRAAALNALIAIAVDTPVLTSSQAVKLFTLMTRELNAVVPGQTGYKSTKTRINMNTLNELLETLLANPIVNWADLGAVPNADQYLAGAAHRLLPGLRIRLDPGTESDPDVLAYMLARVLYPASSVRSTRLSGLETVVAAGHTKVTDPVLIHSVNLTTQPALLNDRLLEAVWLVENPHLTRADRVRLLNAIISPIGVWSRADAWAVWRASDAAYLYQIELAPDMEQALCVAMAPAPGNWSQGHYPRAACPKGCDHDAGRAYNGVVNRPAFCVADRWLLGTTGNPVGYTGRHPQWSETAPLGRVDLATTAEYLLDKFADDPSKWASAFTALASCDDNQTSPADLVELVEAVLG